MRRGLLFIRYMVDCLMTHQAQGLICDGLVVFFRAKGDERRRDFLNHHQCLQPVHEVNRLLDNRDAAPLVTFPFTSR